MSEPNTDDEKSNPFGDMGNIMEEEPPETTETETSTNTTPDATSGGEPQDLSSETASPPEEPPSDGITIRNEATPDPAVVEKLSTTPIPGTTQPTDKYPFAIRRSVWDDERSGNLKFVMRSETQTMEEIAMEEIKEELFPNTDLYKTDIREAAAIVGLQNLDDVVDVLNKWGFAEKEELRK